MRPTRHDAATVVMAMVVVTSVLAVGLAGAAEPSRHTADTDTADANDVRETGGDSTVATPSRSPGVVRVGPGRSVSVRPESRMLFELAITNFTGEEFETTWYLDGEQFSVGGPITWMFRDAGRDLYVTRFRDEGTYHLRAVVHDTDGERLGAVRWTVTVTSDEHTNTAPNVSVVHPRETLLPTRESDRTIREMKFTLWASDPDGDLDRVIWLESGREYVWGRAPLNGSHDVASFTYRGDPAPPNRIYAWVVDENGTMTELQGWQFTSMETESTEKSEETKAP